MIEQTNLPQHSLEKLSANRSFLYGESIFTSGIIFNGEMVFKEAHLSRLKQGILKVYSQIPDALEVFSIATKQLAEQLTSCDGLYGFRITFFADSTDLVFQDKLYYHLKISKLDPLGPIESPLELFLSPAHQYFDSDLKMNRYGETFIQRRKLDAHQDILYFHFRHHILEASTSNIFFIKDQTLITPSLEQGILRGVTRSYILENANQFGLDIEEKKVAVSELGKFDEVFLTNARKFVLPVRKIEEHKYKTNFSSQLRAEILKRLKIGE